MSEHENINLPMSFEDKAHEALVSLWWTGTLLKKFSRKFFMANGTSEAQFNLLNALKYSPGPLTQNELSQRLLVDKSNITGLIDRMEKAGLIQRDQVPGDRRSYHVTLTELGVEVTDQLDAPYWQVVADLMSSFTQTEHGEIIQLMKKLRATLAKIEPDNGN